MQRCTQEQYVKAFDYIEVIACKIVYTTYIVPLGFVLNEAKKSKT